MELIPLPVVLPLLAAAVLVGASSLVSRRVLDVVSCLTAGCNVALCGLLIERSSAEPLVYWFGGWRPIETFPIGISFVVDPIGAGLAMFVSLLALTSFVFSWAYFESVKSLYHALMLVFLAAMCGLCLTGDLFNLFVWFELMTAAGVTLSGYRVDETGPLQGAINFAVMNTLGAYLSLSGVALIYAKTGALNFAQIGATLAAQHSQGWFVPIAFLFVLTGFLVKAAAFPFHFWLDDAHAAAPTPVCVLFSGVMVELGVYAMARLYWTVFAIPLADCDAPVRPLFLLVGSLTALIGAVACFGQRQLKRLLAFSTISHIGLMIIGFALLSPTALAGGGLYLVGHGLVKASLFIGAGILLNRFSSVDEYELLGKGRKMPLIGLIFASGAIGLTGLPPQANFFGESLIDQAAHELGFPWLSLVFAATGILTTAAVLRAAGRIFLGWGVQHDPASRGSKNIPLDQETERSLKRVPITMWLPALLLLILAVAIAPASGLTRAMIGQMLRFQDTRGYAALVLEGHAFAATSAVAGTPISLSGVATKIGDALAAIGLALSALFPQALDRIPLIGFARDGVIAAMRPIHWIHSGRIGDYVAWFVFGIATYGLILVLC